jgi:hypothetical protein
MSDRFSTRITSPAGAQLCYSVDVPDGVTTWACLQDSQGRAVAGIIDQGKGPRCYPGKTKSLPTLPEDDCLFWIETRDHAGKRDSFVTRPIKVANRPIPAPIPAIPIKAKQNRRVGLSFLDIPALKSTCTERHVITWHWGDSAITDPDVVGFNDAHVPRSAGTLSAMATWIDGNGGHGAQPFEITVDPDTRPVVPVTNWPTLKAAVAKGGQYVKALNLGVLAQPEELPIGPDTFLDLTGTTLDWQLKYQGNIAPWPMINGRDYVVVGGAMRCSARAGDPDDKFKPIAFRAYTNNSVIGTRIGPGINYICNTDQEKPQGQVVVGLLLEGMDFGEFSGYGLWGGRGGYQYGQPACSDFVIKFCKATNSTRQHIIRVAGVDRCTVFGNALGNPDNSTRDRYDIAKGAVVFHLGSHLAANFNTINSPGLPGGPMGAGPLSGGDGAKVPNAADVEMHCWQFIGNKSWTSDNIKSLIVDPGAHDGYVDGNELARLQG